MCLWSNTIGASLKMYFLSRRGGFSLHSMTLFSKEKMACGLSEWFPRMWFLQREDCHFIAWIVLSGDTGIKAGLLWLMFCRTGCFHFAVVDIAVIGNGGWNFQDLFSLVSHLLGCLFAYDTVRKGTLIMQSYPSFPSEFLQSVCLFCL